MATILKFSPPTKDVLSQYVAAAKAHEYIDLAGSEDGYILIVDQDEQFVCGVTIFRPRGLYVLFEDAVSRPGLHPRVAYSAGELMIQAIITYCNIHNKVPVCPVTSKSLAQLMSRYGFYAVPSFVMRKQRGSNPADVVEPKGQSTGWVPPRDRPKESPSSRGVGEGRAEDNGPLGETTIPPSELNVNPAVRAKRKARRRV